MVDVFRRPKSRYWHFELMVNGERIRKSTRRTDKKEAERVAAEALRSLLDAEQFGATPEITLREALFEKYLPLRVKLASYKTLSYYCALLCGDVDGVKGIGRGGRMMMHEVTEDMLQSYRTQRLGQGKAEQTIDHELKPFSAANRLVSRSYRTRPGIKVPMARPKGRPRPLSDDEVSALLQDLDPSRKIMGRGGTAYLMRPLARTQLQRVDNYDLAVMLLDTGARWSEIARMTWDMVDTVDFEWIDIFRSKISKNGRRVDARLATTPRMASVLRRRAETRGNSLYVFAGWANKDVDEDGDLPRDGNAAIRRAMNRVGINHPAKVERFGGRRTVRALRDTFATRLRRQGMGLDDLQTLLGHASPQMTAKYADYDAFEASRKAVEMMKNMPGA